MPSGANRRQLFTPAQLGFDALVVAAATTVTGSQVEIAGFRSILLHLTSTAASNGQLFFVPTNPIDNLDLTQVNIWRPGATAFPLSMIISMGGGVGVDAGGAAITATLMPSLVGFWRGKFRITTAAGGGGTFSCWLYCQD